MKKTPEELNAMALEKYPESEHEMTDRVNSLQRFVYLSGLTAMNDLIVELNLPTDEEIKNIAIEKSTEIEDGMTIYNVDKGLGIIEGIEYLREQITNQLKNKG